MSPTSIYFVEPLDPELSKRLDDVMAQWVESGHMPSVGLTLNRDKDKRIGGGCYTIEQAIEIAEKAEAKGYIPRVFLRWKVYQSLQPPGKP